MVGGMRSSEAAGLPALRRCRPHPPADGGGAAPGHAGVFVRHRHCRTDPVREITAVMFEGGCARWSTSWLPRRRELAADSFDAPIELGTSTRGWQGSGHRHRGLRPTKYGRVRLRPSGAEWASPPGAVVPPTHRSHHRLREDPHRANEAWTPGATAGEDFALTVRSSASGLPAFDGG